MEPSQQRQNVLKARKEGMEGQTAGGSNENLSYKGNSKQQVLTASVYRKQQLQYPAVVKL